VRRVARGRRRHGRAGVAGRACVLVSGGLDSAVLLRDTLRAHRLVRPLYVRAGLHWERIEIQALRRFLGSLHSPRLLPLAIIEMPMADLYGRHWSVSGRGGPRYHDGDETVYLPGRNIALFSKAATFCALHRIPVLVSGILSANPFPDGTPAFFRAMERALSRGLGAPLRLRAPFRRMTKDRVVRRGRDLRLDLTVSCVRPLRGGRHCGGCSKCAERARAFRDAGVPDPTAYAGGPGARAAAAGRTPSPKPESIRLRTTRVAPNRTTRSR